MYVKPNTIIILQFKNTFCWLWSQVALSILYFYQQDETKGDYEKILVALCGGN